MLQYINLFLVSVAVDCAKVQAPINGSLRGNYTTFPNKLHFYCDDGFILRGSSARGCMANRTWSGQETTCEGTYIFFALFCLHLKPSIDLYRYQKLCLTLAED